MSQSQVLETSLSTRTHCSSSEQEGGHPVKSRIPRIWFVFNWRKGTDPTCKWKKHVFQNFRTCSTGAKLKILGIGLQLFWLPVRKSPQWLATRREAPLREAEGSTGKQEQLDDQKLQIWIVDRSWIKASWLQAHQGPFIIISYITFCIL